MPLPPATWPVARQLREILAMFRAQGAPFDGAWCEALARFVRDPEWREALEQTRGAWQRAYDRAPARAGELALAALVPEAPGFEQPGGEDGGRLCAWCEQPIRRRDPRARYCSVEHRRAAERAIARAREDQRRQPSQHPPDAGGSCAPTPITPMEALR